MKTRVGEGGRLVIPAPIRKAIGFQPGDEVIVRLVEGEVRISTTRQAIQRAQQIVAQFVTPDRSLADELSVERRAEASRD